MPHIADLFEEAMSESKPQQTIPSLPHAHKMNAAELVVFLTKANAMYRKGTPIIDDDTYDHVYLARLKALEPTHPFLHSVEEEGNYGSGKVRHRVPMLSTDKAYDSAEIQKFLDRVNKVATQGVSFSVTAKLDGIAAKYEHGVLATRGNGLLGNDITHIFDRGVKIIGGESGVGEIVVDQHYFDSNLKDHFDHPRNFVSGVVSAETLNEQALQALEDGAIHFVLFSGLQKTVVNGDELASNVEQLCADIESQTPYLTDGAVISVTDKDVRDQMGATSHHNRWQIAKKTKGEESEALIKQIVWQTGRSGRITPVIEIEPVYLSGAQISRITAHHAGMVKAHNLSQGTKINIVRSGEVIPKFLSVTDNGEHDHQIPDACPACNAETKLEGDFLVCKGSNCTAQVEARLLHYFNIIGNIDLFGDKTVAKLVENGYQDLLSIYAMDVEAFMGVGFSAKQGQNLVDQLERSRTEAVEDWRFLGAQAIHHLGRGDSRKLLKVFDIENLDQLTPDGLIQIPGFGEITSKEIPEGIQSVWPTIRGLLDLGFNLQSDKDVPTLESPITGKNIVFTGAMSVPRNDLKEGAVQLGANVQSSVNKKTDFLVIGEKVGATKINKAESLGTQVITEADYIDMIKS